MKIHKRFRYQKVKKKTESQQGHNQRQMSVAKDLMAKF